MENMPIRKYFIDDLIFFPAQLEISHRHLCLGLVFLLVWIKCDQHFLLLTRRWLRKSWKLFKLWHCLFKSGQTSSWEYCYCLKNPLSTQYDRELWKREITITTSLLFLCSYTLCSKNRFIIAIFCNQVPCFIFPPSLFFQWLFWPGACTAHPCLQQVPH